MTEYKFCKICQCEKPFSEFSFNKNTKDKKYPYCKLCKSEYAKRHYLINRDKYIKNATDRYNNLKEK